MASRRSARGQTMQPAPPAGESDGNMAHPDWLRAYQAGEMAADDAIEFEQAVRSGELSVPADFQLRYTKEGPLDVVKQVGSGIKEAVTGEKRQTATTREASDILLSPEWAEIQKGIKGAGPDVGTVKGVAKDIYASTLGPLVEPVRAGLREAASPAEQVQMIQAANPGLEIQKDEAGNTFFVSPRDQKKYIIQPGWNVTDIPRIAANATVYAPTGAVSGLGKAAAAAAGTQALLETEQMASGGTFNPEEVAIAGAGGALGEGLGRVAQGIKAARGAAPEVVEQAAQAAPDVLSGPELGRVVQAANAGDAAARRQIAQMADVDVEAAKAAVELGMDVPIGMLAKNQQIGEINAALRAKMGSEAAGVAANVERELAQKADDALEQMGAAFVEGRPQPAAVSEKALASLQGTIGQLKGEADTLYKQVDAAVPAATRVPMDNVKDLLEKRLAEYGGDAASLSAGEQRLLKLVERQGADAAEGAVTYRALVDEKAAVQRALRSEMAQSAYGSADRRLLGQLETALKNDQLAAVEALGGREAANALKTANRLTFRRKAVEARAMQAFGKDLEGDLAPLMKRAIAGAAKGENKALRQMLKVVPPEMRGEAAATALASIGRKPDGAFSPTVFAKNYAGLRANPEAYAALVKELPPGSDKMLSAVYSLSNRLSKAAQQTPRTGKALDELGALDGIMGKIAESGLAKKGAVGAGAVVGGAVAGPAGAGIGGAVADSLMGMLTQNKGRVLDAAANLMRDPSLVQLAIEQGAGEVTESTVKQVARSAALREFLRAVKMPRTPSDAEAWVWGAVRGVRAGEQQQ